MCNHKYISVFNGISSHFISVTSMQTQRHAHEKTKEKQPAINYSMRGGLLEWRSDGLELCLRHKRQSNTISNNKRKENTYDLLRTPSFLNPSIIFNISLRPEVASTLFPAKLILTF